MKLSQFASLWMEVLHVHNSSDFAYNYSKNKSIYFGKEKDVKSKNIDRITLESHILKLTNAQISGSTLLQTYHKQVMKYFERFDPEALITVSLEKVDILKRFVQEGYQRYNLDQSHQITPNKKGEVGENSQFQLSSYFDTDWELYSYREQSSSEQKTSSEVSSILEKGISKAILRIDNQGNANVFYSVASEISKNEIATYIGRLFLREDNVPSIELRTQKTNELALIIYIQRFVKRVYPLNLGLFISKNDKYVLEAGTLVMKRIHQDKTKQYKPEYLPAGTSTFHQIDRAIRQFLKDRLHNTILLPSGITTINDLSDFLQTRRSINIQQPDRYKNFEFDAFISAPVASLKEILFEMMKAEVLKIISVLTKVHKFQNIYYAGNEFTSKEEVWRQEVIERRYVLDKINNSRYFVAIYPESVISSSLIETGWALSARKPTILFYKNLKDLPILLQKSKEVRYLVSIKHHQYTVLQDIPNYIAQNINLFNWHL